MIIDDVFQQVDRLIGAVLVGRIGPTLFVAHISLIFWSVLRCIVLRAAVCLGSCEGHAARVQNQVMASPARLVGFRRNAVSCGLSCKKSLL